MGINSIRNYNGILDGAQDVDGVNSRSRNNLIYDKTHKINKKTKSVLKLDIGFLLCYNIFIIDREGEVGIEIVKMLW